MKRVEVKSSTIKSIGYDEATQTLEVQFLTESVYQYNKVPKTVYEKLMKAESIGSFFARFIKHSYVFKFVKEQK